MKEKILEILGATNYCECCRFLIFFAVSANFTNILLNFNSVFCSGFVLYGNVDAGFRELIRDRLASLFVKDVKTEAISYRSK